MGANECMSPQNVLLRLLIKLKPFQTIVEIGKDMNNILLLGQNSLRGTICGCHEREYGALTSHATLLTCCNHFGLL